MPQGHQGEDIQANPSGLGGESDAVSFCNSPIHIQGLVQQFLI